MLKLTDYVYEIFKTNSANNGNDVCNVGLPMFVADLGTGENKYVPAELGLDLKAMKEEWDEMSSADRSAEFSRANHFMHKYYNQLVHAYQSGKEAVVEAVKAGEEKDAAEQTPHYIPPVKQFVSSTKGKKK